MKYTDPTGQEYDFARCTREQLEYYLYDMTKCGHGHLFSHCDSGRVALAAARVPREKKSDVAKELAEYLVKCSGVLYSAQIFMDVSNLTERYRKAVDV